MKKFFFLAALALSAASAWAGEPLKWSKPIIDGATYAIVNVQPNVAAAPSNYYLNNTDGTLTPVSIAKDATTDFEWPETAKFVAEKQADGKFAFKNVSNDMYLAWKSHNAGENSMKGFVSTVELWSSWTMNASTRSGWTETYWLSCAKRASATNGVGTLLIANDGSWNAANAEWTTSAYSNNYGFVMLGISLEAAKAEALTLADRIGEGFGKYHFDGDKTYGYAEAVEACTTAEEVTTLINSVAINLPKAGDLLVFCGATTGKYVYADAESASNDGSKQLAQGDLGWPNDPADYDKWASAIFYYDGLHLISYSSPTATGLYVFRSNLDSNPLNATKDEITFHEGSKVGCYRIHTDNANSNWYDYYGTTGRINRWSANDAELTNFRIEQPSYDYVHIGSAGYATVCLPVDVAWEYGEHGAYTVNDVDGVLKATPISGCIPAGVPALITGEPGNYILKPAGRWASADAEQFTTNVLRGTYAAMEKPANALVFNVLDETPGFYGYTGSYLNGFKAYYENPTGASNLRINFEGTLTAIESAVETAQGHQLFDLQGRRVNGAAHGLFIQNGKKVIK